jgi:hypothetical protein
MLLRSTVTLSVVVLASMAAAQDQLCTPAKASTITEGAGVKVQQVMLSGKWGSNSANVFLPDKETAEGAVVLSHSAIRAETGASVDLLRFALTLARAGAAVIVPDRTLNWPPGTERTNREGAVVACAAHWMIDNVKVVNDGQPLTNADRTVIREGYGYVGPRICDPEVADHCRLSSPFNVSGYYRHHVSVPIGETEGGDNTNGMLSTGGLHAAQWLQRMLGLAPIKAIVPASIPSPGS